jgi:phosphopantetheine adenylyltransferase
LGLSQDILLDDTAFNTASSEMQALKTRTEALKTMLKEMYRDLTTALDTPAGKQVEQTAEEVLIKPIEDLLLVIQHVSDTLNEIIGTGYYKDIFIKFEQLNQDIKFD